MLDSDLAELYQVSTKVFNQAVKRNFDRFPEDFMFQLTAGETGVGGGTCPTLSLSREWPCFLQCFPASALFR